MNANSMILNDNILYLEAWMKQNASLQNELQIINSQLIWKHNEKTETLDLQHFYLPNLLFNSAFQRDIQNPEAMTAEDLFRIIRVHILANEYVTPSLLQEKLYLVRFECKRDQDGNPFVLFQDNFGKQYRIQNNVPRVIAIYEKLKVQKNVVMLKDFKKELEKNGSK